MSTCDVMCNVLGEIIILRLYKIFGSYGPLDVFPVYKKSRREKVTHKIISANCCPAPVNGTKNIIT